MNSEITGETGATGNPNPAPQPQPQPAPNKDDILKELSELRKAENERKIKEYESKYNFNYNENAQDKEIIDKLLSGDVDMELMEKLAKEELKLKLVMMFQLLVVAILQTLVMLRN